MNKKEIRKSMIMELVSHAEYKPLKAKEILGLFGLKKKEAESLQEILDELCIEGKIIQTIRNKYMLSNDDTIVSGKFIANAAGFGFVEIEGKEEDIFIPDSKTGGAFHNDMVTVRILSEQNASARANGRRTEGQVIKVLKRGFTQLTGVYTDSRSFGFVIPDITKIGTDIYIGKGLNNNAKQGDKVVVKLLSYGTSGEKPRGEIIEILGSSESVEVDITAIARTYDLPQEFPEKTLQEADSYVPEIDPAELKKRLDLREQFVITIDGEDAKDLDDAVSIEKVGDVYRLGVHIADVSHYVPEYSELDIEAAKRGTSHYLVDRVIPMLPKQLSNGLCSLNPHEDKLTLSCIMNINSQGKVISHEIKESVICSNYRMTYNDVAKLLEPERCVPEEKDELFRKYEEVMPHLTVMAECAKALQDAREHRGAIDFDFTEAKFILNEDSSVKEIKPYDRNVATRLIEDFMLIANETVAEHFFWQGTPFLYRSHGEPKEDKIEELSGYLKAMDYPFRRKVNLHPKDLQTLLEECSGKPEENIIRRMVLRSMQQAKYTEYCEGHFGLSLKYYSHFTSPIRRYPDLQIHRIIKEILSGKWNAQRQEHYTKRLPNIAVKSSTLERRADEVERDVHKLLKAIYMEKFIGKHFDGAVSGVTQWGMFVELPNTVEGLVSISSLQDDFYDYDERSMSLIGSMTGHRYHLGDKVKVTVSAVDKARKVVDFLLYDEDNIIMEKKSGFAVEEMDIHYPKKRKDDKSFAKPKKPAKPSFKQSSKPFVKPAAKKSAKSKNKTSSKRKAR